MAPMNYRVDAKLKKEKYQATLPFIMAGPWYISIIINHAGRLRTRRSMWMPNKSLFQTLDFDFSAELSIQELLL